jgi:hypothetical protein
MEQKVCQSCGMPLGEDDSLLGTDKDGHKTDEYCVYCYQNGEFTFQGNMEGMAEVCIKPLVESMPGLTEAEARNMMLEVLPTLNRWKA